MQVRTVPSHHKCKYRFGIIVLPIKFRQFPTIFHNFHNFQKSKSYEIAFELTSRLRCTVHTNKTFPVWFPMVCAPKNVGCMYTTIVNLQIHLCFPINSTISNEFHNFRSFPKLSESCSTILLNRPMKKHGFSEAARGQQGGALQAAGVSGAEKPLGFENHCF